LPRRCVACGIAGAGLCEACRARLSPLTAVCCSFCGAPTAWPVERCLECRGRRLAFASARGAVSYTGPARAIVHGWKERGLRRLAPLAADVVASVFGDVSADVITYIPPDPGRQLRRAEHPAQALARELGRRWSLPFANTLRRTRSSTRQVSLAPAERRRNVAGAFVAVARVPRHVLLVDDVYTTGATASEAARALIRAGAGRVDVITFARAIRR
jgi:predicted amidophosphoribosyltransferase